MKATKVDKFFAKLEARGEAVTYAQVRLKTGYSEVIPSSGEIDLSTKFSRNITMNNVIVSSPMDTVTESNTAIEMAKWGCLGIIHRGLIPKVQADEVARVKFYLNGLIEKPITIFADDKVSAVLKMIEEKKYSFRSFPVIDKDGHLIGVIAGNDFDFCGDDSVTVGKIMSRDLITAKSGISLKKAYDKMRQRKKKILPLIGKGNRLAGIYVFSDVKRIITGGSPIYNLDSNGNLRVGAAIGVGEEALARAELLVRKKVDVLVIDTAHGDTKFVIDTLKKMKHLYPEIDVVVGNISESDSAARLIKAGVDGLKVGQGPGSICTTRVVAGIGCPQVTAIYNCVKVARQFDIPVCADGGIEYSGDIPIALAAGASSVMLGSLLAGTDESPGDIIMTQDGPVKNYRGMGSLGAMLESRAARERYGQADSKKDKLVPEGVEGVVPYKGKLSDVMFQLTGGLKSGMGYLGARTIRELQAKADFYAISSEGLEESHPHGIKITKIAPNYQQRRRI